MHAISPSISRKCINNFMLSLLGDIFSFRNYSLLWIKNGLSLRCQFRTAWLMPSAGKRWGELRSRVQH
jgi:hypothetical protein